MSDLATRFDERGFVIIDSGLGTEFTRLNALIEGKLGEGNRIQTPDVRAFGSIGTLHDFPELMRTAAHPRLLNILSALAGSRSVYFQRATVFAKPGNRLSTPWHQDCSYWNDPAASGACHHVALLCYLTPTSVEGGALRVIPGSHRNDHPLHHWNPAVEEERVKLRNQLRTGEVPDHPLASHHPDQVAVPVQHGEVVAIDARLLHGAFANTVDANRNLVTYWYFLGFEGLLPGTKQRLSRGTRELFEKLELDPLLSALLPPPPEDGVHELPEYRIPSFPR